jgi:hypothetical protein
MATSNTRYGFACGPRDCRTVVALWSNDENR